MSIEASHWISTVPKTIPITDRARLEEEPDVAFELATAPDGLPLAMHVRRAIDVRDPVLRALGTNDIETVPRDVRRALDDLARGARSLSVTRGVVRNEGVLHYETSASISTLFGQTMLARMLGATSPTVMPEDRARTSSAPERFTNTSLLAISDMQARADEPLPSTPAITTGRDASLLIGLGREKRVCVGTRTMQFESLLALRSARWHVWNQEGTQHEGRLADTRAYVKALRDARRLAWSVSRHDTIQLVAELARSVERDWHSRQRVHGDLKPGNVLLEQTGITAFDAIDIAAGELCAGVTEGWAAPEQITVRPVSPASDVFALGLMLASALAGSVFGEETTVIVPAAGSGRRRLHLMKDADVWIDPQVVPLERTARLAWRELIVQCLAFDPARRPTSGGVLAERILSLLGRSEVPGQLAVACGPGDLELTIGSREPMWLLRDSR